MTTDELVPVSQDRDSINGKATKQFLNSSYLNNIQSSNNCNRVEY